MPGFFLNMGQNQVEFFSPVILLANMTFCSILISMLQVLSLTLILCRITTTSKEQKISVSAMYNSQALEKFRSSQLLDY